MSYFPTTGHARGRGLKILIVVAASVTHPARAETVFDAMSDAYDRNPAIAAERERLKATDQSIPAAQAGYLPTVTASADVGVQQAKYAIAPDQTVRQKPYGWSVTLDQRLFDGGAALAAVRRATAGVRAGQQVLLSTETSVLLAAATAFADVQRTRAVIALQSESVTALAAILAQTRERRGVGDATVADLSQSEATYANAELQLATARTAQSDAEAQFLEIVRRAAGRIEPFSAASVSLPDKLDEAFRRADTQHPAIVAARDREIAAHHAVEVAAAKYLPNVSLQASFQSRRDIDGYVPASTPQSGASVGAVARIPLYTGGSVDAEVRAAYHTQLSLVHELDRTRAAIRTGVSASWAARQQNEKSLLLLARQVEAGRTALASLRKEQAVGQRTLTDVLTAERDLVAARIALEQARRDAVVTRFAMLASVGELSAAAITAPPHPQRHAATTAQTPKTTATRWATTVHIATTRVAAKQ